MRLGALAQAHTHQFTLTRKSGTGGTMQALLVAQCQRCGLISGGCGKASQAHTKTTCCGSCLSLHTHAHTHPPTPPCLYTECSALIHAQVRDSSSTHRCATAHSRTGAQQLIQAQVRNSSADPPAATLDAGAGHPVSSARCRHSHQPMSRPPAAAWTGLAAGPLCMACRHMFYTDALLKVPCLRQMQAQAGAATKA